MPEQDRYTSAVHLLGRGLQTIDQQKDPGLWTMCNGLLQLATALQQDMKDLKARLAAIDSDVKSIR